MRGKHRGRRRAVARLATLLATCLTACGPTLPDSVVPGSAVTVGWEGTFTSANAAAAPTPGNVDIAEAIRADFGDMVDGEFVADEAFGTITVVGEDPFTVRYDLAEPAWSDGIPLDAADLLLGWAGSNGYFDPAEDDDGGAGAEDGADADSAGADPATGAAVPALDEFARAIEVTFPQPVRGWQQAVAAPVPAHVVGRRAFGLDDAMAAKQAVISAIQESDASALEKIVAVWNEGFDVADRTDIPSDLLVSSGPFLVDRVTGDEAGQSVRLVPNPSYRGAVPPKIARIALVPPGDMPVAAVGDQFDIVQVTPAVSNRVAIRELERRDFTVETTHDGTVWALLLRPAGAFATPEARTAFIHAVPARAMIDRGAGDWASAYTGTTSMLTAPGSRAYDIVNEDSGFAEALGAPDEEPELEREAAGVAPGSPVCVLYDRQSEFAAGAFAALQDAAAEAGWNAVDCGSDDYGSALEQGGWDATIARVPIPQSPEQIAAQWGGQGGASLTGHADPDRDVLITELAHTPDVYEARDLLARIEATIVRAAVALPIAVNPRVTIIDRDVEGVAARNGAAAPLTSGVAQWAIAR